MSGGLTDSSIWKKLLQDAARMNQAENHLRHLLAAPGRLERFSAKGAGLFYDFSRQRVDGDVLVSLLELARSARTRERFQDMMAGARVNVSEGRAALHTATRAFANTPVRVDGQDVMPDIRSVRDQIKTFAHRVHSGELTGSTGKPFRHVVVIGIGGSYLGTQFVANALGALADKGMRLHFLSNVDIHNFGAIMAAIAPEKTLWVIISKSFTTAETSANANLAYAVMAENGLRPEDHVVTVTAKGSPGDDPSNPVLASFHMFDFIGGRYSVTSAVGGLPLSLVMGYDRFESFLKGAEEMDIHAARTEEETNLPLLAAMISIWNNNFLKYPAQGVIPYASPLDKLAPHIQQLYMESNGKAVDVDGRAVSMETGVIIFGEPGTNAQHSFFQLAHQGRTFPIDFIGVLEAAYNYSHQSKGVTNHQELWANLISQPLALAMGKDDDDKAKAFPGNRPSSLLVLKDLSPQNIGRLLAFYEAKTIFEAFVWRINPFDQFGVELGKTLAGGIRREIAQKNKDREYAFSVEDDFRGHYLRALFSEKAF